VLASTPSQQLENFVKVKFYWPLLVTSSALGLGRRCSSYHQRCYINRLRTILNCITDKRKNSTVILTQQFLAVLNKLVPADVEIRASFARPCSWSTDVATPTEFAMTPLLPA